MNKVSVVIDGTVYQLTGEKSEADIIKVGKFIDDEFKSVKNMAPSLGKIDISILTSINIADKYFEKVDEIEDLNEKLARAEISFSDKTEDVEREFDDILSKLDSSEKEIKRLNDVIESLKKGDQKSLDSLVDTSMKESYEKKIKQLEKDVQEMEKKVIVAEKMASEFQNKAYNLQLNLEELRNK